MDNAEPKLLHLPFFEALARAEEGSTEWRLTSAGLVTLRLFDAWFVEGPSVVAADAWGLRAVREAIEAVEPARPPRQFWRASSMQWRTRDRARSAGRASFARVRLARFSSTGGSSWPPTCIAPCIAHAHPVEEADIVIAASMQLGVVFACHWREWDEATAAYRPRRHASPRCPAISSRAYARESPKQTWRWSEEIFRTRRRSSTRPSREADGQWPALTCARSRSTLGPTSRSAAANSSSR